MKPTLLFMALLWGLIGTMTVGNIAASVGCPHMFGWARNVMGVECGASTPPRVVYAPDASPYAAAPVATGHYLRTSTPPTWSATTWPATVSVGDILVATSTNTVSALPADIACSSSTKIADAKRAAKYWRSPNAPTP